MTNNWRPFAFHIRKRPGALESPDRIRCFASSHGGSVREIAGGDGDFLDAQAGDHQLNDDFGIKDEIVRVGRKGIEASNCGYRPGNLCDIRTDAGSGPGSPAR